VTSELKLPFGSSKTSSNTAFFDYIKKEGEVNSLSFFYFCISCYKNGRLSMTYRIHDFSQIIPITAGVLWILLSGLHNGLQAQFPGEFPSRSQQFIVSPDQNTLRLDLLTIEYSIRVTHSDTLISGDYLNFDRNTGTLTFTWPRQWPSLPAELTITWQYRPLGVLREYSLMESSDVLEAGRRVTDTVLAGEPGRAASVPASTSESRLQTNGSITRGIITGSNRDLSLESGLRFDLQGYITDDVYITASLSDQNTLIQPDGTTQNLREFDQVFIRLDAPRTRLQLGDVDAQFSTSRIARLNRRLQGAEGEYKLSEGAGVKAGVAVIRGSYRVVSFNGREGVQGPYRLTGANNETFIIVVAGTEQVFLDGRLLQRGEDHDYTIDYSSGELFFTNRRIIRNLHRIRVEYQYLSNTYARTLLAAEADETLLAGGRITLGVTFLREADATLADDAAGLSEAEREVLRMAGADPLQMRVSGAEFTGFRPDAPWVLYTRIDTLINGQAVSIYENRPADPSGVYRVRFSRVNEGNGSYRRASRTLNGIVYEWVGEGMGDYEPFRQLQAPELKQVISLRSSAAITKGVKASAEWAVSQFEANRFAVGAASTNDQMLISRIEGLDLKPGIGHLALDVYAMHEYQGRNFKFFDRIRDVEFERTWDLEPGFASELNRTEGGVRLRAMEGTHGEYRFQRLQTSVSSGFRNDANLRIQAYGLPDMEIRSGVLNSSNRLAGTRTRWYDLGGVTGYDIDLGTAVRMRPMYSIEAEQRQEFMSGTDSTLPGSFRYVEHIPSMALSGVNWGMMFQYSIREDYEVYQGLLQRSYTSTAPGLEAEYGSAGWITTRNRVAWRDQRSSELFKNVMGRSDVRGLAFRSNTDVRLLNRFVEASVLYDASTESRALLQETYLEVGPEFGQYVWVDLNGDGIQQVDEFFPEQNPGEGIFIKQLIPTDELFPVVALHFRYRVRLDLSRWDVLQQSDGLLSYWLRGLSYSVNLDIREQNESEERRRLYLLHSDALLDFENTISGRIQQVHELQMFRNVRETDVRVRTDRLKALNRLAAGLDEVQRTETIVEGRQLVDQTWAFEALLRVLQRRNLNTDISTRNFDITGWEIGPGLVRTEPGTSRYALRSTYGSREDGFFTNGAKVDVFRFIAEALVDVTDGFQGGLRLEHRRMNVVGLSTPAGVFEMTEGAGEGNTWLWNLQLQWRSEANIRATFNYDGRTTSLGTVIQTFRMSVSAVF
jgi:hypothetical protein